MFMRFHGVFLALHQKSGQKSDPQGKAASSPCLRPGSTLALRGRGFHPALDQGDAHAPLEPQHKVPRPNGRGLTQLPHSKPCFGSIKAHKCLVFLEECWKAHIVTNSTSFSLDFPNEYARLDDPIEVIKPKT